MVDFYHYPAKNFNGEDTRISINSGPVVIDDEGKFLLHISSSTGKYQFTGGRIDDSKSPQENAVYRPFQDLGVEVELNLEHEPLVIVDKLMREGVEETIVLIHYLARVKQGSEPTKSEWAWFTLDEVRKLHEEGNVSSANILIACEHFMR